MIPKLIHQTAKTIDLPKANAVYQATVCRLHPDWTYKLWTDSDNDAFVREHYPDFYSTFVAYPKGIMRADVIRYLLMDTLGGLYLDTDYEMFRPFDQLDFGAVVPWESSGEWGEGRDILGNAIFAAAPGDPFFRRVIETLKNRDPVPADANVLTTTGPAFITQVYRSMTPAEQVAVHTPPRSEFHPRTPRNQREHLAIKQSGAYGVHHCNGTWREYTLPQRLKQKLGRIYHFFR